MSIFKGFDTTPDHELRYPEAQIVEKDSRDARIAELEARNRKLEKALRPFAEAYEQFAKNEHCTRVLSLGQLGRLAAGELSGAHFKTASAALSTKEDGT